MFRKQFLTFVTNEKDVSKSRAMAYGLKNMKTESTRTLIDPSTRKSIFLFGWQEHLFLLVRQDI